jgi:L-ascorbate metabolism protein UlaG (beta-lactamase superfamily)
MNVTKFGHACVVLEEQGQKLIIDPGGLTDTMGDISNISAVVVTHVHFDHLSQEHIQTILAQNPQVQIYGPQEVVTELLKNNVQAIAVTQGSHITAGVFTLSFYGEKHALIHADYPQNQNVGVLVNGSFYYPGDSFMVPDAPVKVLALPTSGPWLKTGESIDFYLAIKPPICFPTHNGLLNEIGEKVVDDWLTPLAEKNNAVYQVLKPGDSLQI